MAFQKVKRVSEIAGFWTREKESVVVGRVKKFIPNQYAGFYIFELSEGGTPLQGPDEKSAGRLAVVGEVIGVTGSGALEPLQDMVGRGIIRLTSMGQAEAKGGKQGFWDIEIEFDPDGKLPDTNKGGKIPF